MIVLFTEGVLEAFVELPRSVQQQAARSIELLSTFPGMFPIRRRGIMCGYRYFVAGRFLFYYTVTTAEVRIAAIIPGSMRAA